ncbi:MULTISPECIES: trypsin-like serine peptidase [unclassified Mycobacterium]|uniref:trypsin-like serine peptidase n=1 Tax=unclassified Mycobacterium TaxID=2642494 RepID=UPI0029C69B93|nr:MULTISPECIES: trypsin-like serine protease [unclassified Mycobacterium]
MRGRWMVFTAALLVLTASCTRAIPGAVERPTIQTSPVPAAAVGPDLRVGAVFLGDKNMHVCSASVLDSAAGDLIVTAAHCMANGIDAYFVPGYDKDADDKDYWRIDAVYLDPRWMASQDPLADFAIARVSRDGSGSLESQVGGGFTIGGAPSDGTEVTVTGYAIGIGGEQLGCQARTGTLHGYPSVPCAGFVDGTSGAPWIANSTVTGVIGGLDGGGCQEDVSYSPPFDGAIKQLLARAEAGGPGDAAPTTFLSEC